MTQSHTYLPLDVTPEQRENLTKLGVYLLTNDVDDFDMSTFRSRDGTGLTLLGLVEAQNKCGTVGCAVGHGPNAGVEILPEDKGWPEYTIRAFGAGGMGNSIPLLAGPLWNWLFDEAWALTDNTPTGAGLRIQIALEKGIPANYWLQQYGDDPLEYRA